MAPPPTDIALVNKALELVRGGMTPQEAAAELGGAISWRTIYRALKREQGVARAPAKKPPPKIATRPGKRRPTETPPETATPPAIPDDVPADKRELWILEREIEHTRTTLAQMRAEKSTRTAALQKQLVTLLKEARALRPPPPPSPDEEERHWRAEAEAVLRLIETGVREAESRGAATQVGA